MTSAFRRHIEEFFTEADWVIVEIGCHQGHTTRRLAEVFDRVYTVDVSRHNLLLNRLRNRDKRNVHHFQIDVYRDAWDAIPIDADVAFIDAAHSFSACYTRYQELPAPLPPPPVHHSGRRWCVRGREASKFLAAGELRRVRFMGATRFSTSRGELMGVHEGVLLQVRRAPSSTKL